MSETIVENWLAAVVNTTEQRDYVAHMNLISKGVTLLGVPRFNQIGYDDWSIQVKHEFEQATIANITYRGLKLRTTTATRIMFVTHETVTASDGSQNSRSIECILEKEPDTQWRLTQQRILGQDETLQYLPRLVN